MISETIAGPHTRSNDDGIQAKNSKSSKILNNILGQIDKLSHKLDIRTLRNSSPSSGKKSSPTKRDLEKTGEFLEPEFNYGAIGDDERLNRIYKTAEKMSQYGDRINALIDQMDQMYVANQQQSSRRTPSLCFTPEKSPQQDNFLESCVKLKENSIECSVRSPAGSKIEMQAMKLENIINAEVMKRLGKNNIKIEVKYLKKPKSRRLRDPSYSPDYIYDSTMHPKRHTGRMMNEAGSSIPYKEQAQEYPGDYNQNDNALTFAGSKILPRNKKAKCSKRGEHHSISEYLDSEEFGVMVNEIVEEGLKLSKRSKNKDSSRYKEDEFTPPRPDFRSKEGYPIIKNFNNSHNFSSPNRDSPNIRVYLSKPDNASGLKMDIYSSKNLNGPEEDNKRASKLSHPVGQRGNERGNGAHSDKNPIKISECSPLVTESNIAASTHKRVKRIVQYPKNNKNSVLTSSNFSPQKSSNLIRTQPTEAKTYTRSNPKINDDLKTTIVKKNPKSQIEFSEHADIYNPFPSLSLFSALQKKLIDIKKKYIGLGSAEIEELTDFLLKSSKGAINEFLPRYNPFYQTVKHLLTTHGNLLELDFDDTPYFSKDTRGEEDMKLNKESDLIIIHSKFIRSLDRCLRNIKKSRKLFKQSLKFDPQNQKHFFKGIREVVLENVKKLGKAVTEVLRAYLELLGESSDAWVSNGGIGGEYDPRISMKNLGFCIASLDYDWDNDGVVHEEKEQVQSDSTRKLRGMSNEPSQRKLNQHFSKPNEKISLGKTAVADNGLTLSVAINQSRSPSPKKPSIYQEDMQNSQRFGPRRVNHVDLTPIQSPDKSIRSHNTNLQNSQQNIFKTNKSNYSPLNQTIRDPSMLSNSQMSPQNHIIRNPSMHSNSNLSPQNHTMMNPSGHSNNNSRVSPQNMIRNPSTYSNNNSRVSPHHTIRNPSTYSQSNNKVSSHHTIRNPSIHSNSNMSPQNHTIRNQSVHSPLSQSTHKPGLNLMKSLSNNNLDPNSRNSSLVQSHAQSIPKPSSYHRTESSKINPSPSQKSFIKVYKTSSIPSPASHKLLHSDTRKHLYIPKEPSLIPDSTSRYGGSQMSKLFISQNDPANEKNNSNNEREQFLSDFSKFSKNDGLTKILESKLEDASNSSFLELKRQRISLVKAQGTITAMRLLSSNGNIAVGFNTGELLFFNLKNKEKIQRKNNKMSNHSLIEECSKAHKSAINAIEVMWVWFGDSKRNTDSRLKGSNQQQHFMERSSSSTNKKYKMANISGMKKILLTGGSESECSILVWDLKTRKPIKRLSGHKHLISSIQDLGDYCHVATSSFDSKIAIWDIRNDFNCKKVVEIHNSPILSLSYCKKTQEMVAGYMDGKVNLWKVEFEDYNSPSSPTSEESGDENNQNQEARNFIFKDLKQICEFSLRSHIVKIEIFDNKIFVLGSNFMVTVFDFSGNLIGEFYSEYPVVDFSIDMKVFEEDLRNKRRSKIFGDSHRQESSSHRLNTQNVEKSERSQNNGFKAYDIHSNQSQVLKPIKLIAVDNRNNMICYEINKELQVMNYPDKKFETNAERKVKIRAEVNNFFGCNPKTQVWCYGEKKVFLMKDEEKKNLILQEF